MTVSLFVTPMTLLEDAWNTSNGTEAADVIGTFWDVGFLTYYYGLFIVITLVNIPGNIIVIVTVLRHEHLRQPCNYYISSLAVSDLLRAFVYPVYNISHIGVATISDPLGE